MIHSPNTVLAKYLADIADIVKPRLEIQHPKAIEFFVGTNINGAPHIGTYLTHSLAFVLARRVQDTFKVPLRIVFGIHDNISYDSKTDSSGRVYHRTYNHALGEEGIQNLIDKYYSAYFEALSRSTGISHTVAVYSHTQRSRTFREHFLKTLAYADKIRWCVAPSSGFLQVRVPCPQCFYSERDAAQTALTRFDGDTANFTSCCLEHGVYHSTITRENDTYIDLNTLYRNVIKEFTMIDSHDLLHVVIKGGDWVYSTATIDLALGILGCTAVQQPMRIFLPQIVTATGAKLSKSLVLEGHESVKEIPKWMIDMEIFKEMYADYPEQLLGLSEQMLTDPRHTLRAYSYQEIERLLGL